MILSFDCWIDLSDSVSNVCIVCSPDAFVLKGDSVVEYVPVVHGLI